MYVFCTHPSILIHNLYVDIFCLKNSQALQTSNSALHYFLDPLLDFNHMHVTILPHVPHISFPLLFFILCLSLFQYDPSSVSLTSPSAMSNLCSVQFSSVAQLCLTLCNPMNCSTPGLPVHQQLPEFTQTHVHRVSDAIQPSHPLSSPSPPAPNPSQHQSLFQ